MRLLRELCAIVLTYPSQHNMAKVYSGLHEAAGHIVPYIVSTDRRFPGDFDVLIRPLVLQVVVKVGKPSERSRPGNRGKRDSQMLLMRFLNRVHFDAPMAPCELEMYHQIKNVIGVNPSFYEVSFLPFVSERCEFADARFCCSTCSWLTLIQSSTLSP